MRRPDIVIQTGKDSRIEALAHLSFSGIAAFDRLLRLSAGDH
jgi:hypothetical protein